MNAKEARKHKKQLSKAVLQAQKKLRVLAKKQARVINKLEKLRTKRHEHFIGQKGLPAAESKKIDIRILALEEKLERLYSAQENLAKAETALHDFVKVPAIERQKSTERIMQIESPDGWALVPEGSFEMGAQGKELTGTEKEGPRRKVTITHPFLISQHEVTRKLWEHVMPQWNLSPCFEANCPITGVNWIEALAFCNALSKSEGVEQCYELRDCVYPRNSMGKKQGLICSRINFVGVECEGYRLPTEAEWEYAARADFSGTRYGPLDEISWHRENSNGAPEPVGRKAPNAWEIYDMLGNVREWVWDWYAKSYNSNSSAIDPKGPRFDPDARKVVRGCSFARGAKALEAEITSLNDCRLAQRAGIHGSFRQTDVGFRIVRTLTDQLMAKLQLNDGVLGTDKVRLESENIVANFDAGERGQKQNPVHKTKNENAAANDREAEEAATAAARAEEKAAAEAQRKAQEAAAEAERKAREAAAEAERKAREAAAEAKRKAQEIAEAKRQEAARKAEAEALARKEAEARANAERQARLAAEALARKEAERQRAREAAEKERAAAELARAEAEARAKTLADAKSLLAEGRKLLRQGNLDKALLILAQSQALNPTPYSNFALGLALLRVGSMEKGCAMLEQIQPIPKGIQVKVGHAQSQCLMHAGAHQQARKRLRRTRAKSKGDQAIVQDILESDLQLRTGNLRSAKYKFKRVKTRGISQPSRILYREVKARLDEAIQDRETKENLKRGNQSIELAKRELDTMQNKEFKEYEEREASSGARDLIPKDEVQPRPVQASTPENKVEATTNKLEATPQKDLAAQPNQDEEAVLEAKRIAQEAREAARLAKEKAKQAAEALEKRKQDAVRLSRQGRRLLNRGATDKAMEKLREAYSLFPHPHTIFALSVAYMRKGNWDTSVSYLNDLEDTLPSKAIQKAHLLCQFALFKGDYEQAEAILAKIPREKDTSSATTHKILEASLYLQKGQLKKANMRFRRIGKQELNYDQKALYLELESRLAEARAKAEMLAAEKARMEREEREAKEAEVLRLLALKEEATLVSLRVVVSEELEIEEPPSPIRDITPNVRRLLSGVRMRNEDRRIARRIARAERQDARRKKFKATHLSRKGQRLMRAGKLDQAFTTLRQANEIYPLPQTTFALGQLNLDMGQWARGCVLVQEASGKLSSDMGPSPSYAIARCALFEGDIKEARRHLKGSVRAKTKRNRLTRKLIEIEIEILEDKITRAEQGLESVAGGKLNRSQRAHYEWVSKALDELKSEKREILLASESVKDDVKPDEKEKAEEPIPEDEEAPASDQEFHEAFAATQAKLRAKRREKAADLSRSGRKLLADGDFDKALPLLVEAFTLFPLPKTEYALARIYMLRGAWVQAETHLLQAQKNLQSEAHGVEQGLARCALHKQDLKAAQRLLRNLRKAKLNQEEALMLRLIEADLLIRKGKLDKATKRLTLIAKKRLNAEMKVIFAEIKKRFENSKATSRNKEKKTTQHKWLKSRYCQSFSKDRYPQFRGSDATPSSKADRKHRDLFFLA